MLFGSGDEERRFLGNGWQGLSEKPEIPEMFAASSRPWSFLGGQSTS